MNLRLLLDSVTTGGKTALGISTAGCFGLIVYSAAATEKVVDLSYAFIAVALASALFGGLRSGLAAGSQGWFHGSLVALLYSVLLYLAKAVLFPASADLSAYVVFTAGLLLAGIAGGVAGVNLRFSRRSRMRRRYLSQ